MKKIFINHYPWQTRIAILKDNKLQNIYFSRHTKDPLERAFFKGVVTKILPGIQTAFVEIGQEKAGFLHISEIDRELAAERICKTTQVDDEGAPKKRTIARSRLDISKILKEGEPVLVQVSKEPVYEKGAKLSTCFTLPGRFIVLMPNIPRIGISKKISDRDERARLKELVRSNLPEGMGAIIRTTCADRDPKEIVQDLTYLVSTWDAIYKKYEVAEPKERLHEDLDLSLQIVRDHLDDDVEEVVTDNKELQGEIYRFVKRIAPEYTQKIKVYTGQTPLFELHGIEKQIDLALDKKVPLKSGGSLIIETTEAMTVIDVNTGRFIGKSNLEETILKTNLEAAEEVARQLRLRNIGGLIVIDFIDMSIQANRQKLYRFFDNTLREQDKFQSVVLKLSEFGLVQMTRKRSGKTLQQELTNNCHNCRGLGFVKSLQTETYLTLHRLRTQLMDEKLGVVTVYFSQKIFEYITSIEYNAVLAIERETNSKITLAIDEKLSVSEYKIQPK